MRRSCSAVIRRTELVFSLDLAAVNTKHFEILVAKFPHLGALKSQTPPGATETGPT
jgi:hypothetical protein